MNPKPATALFAAFILASGEIVSDHMHSLVPRDHVHSELQTEPAATTATYLAASGAQTAFDNEAWSPAGPWERWRRDDPPHVHPEIGGEVSDTLPVPAAFIRQDVTVELTGQALKATAGTVVVTA